MESILTFYSYIHWVLGVGTIAVGLFLLRRDFKKRSNIFLFMTAFTSGLWSIVSTEYVRNITTNTPGLFDNLLSEFFALSTVLMFFFFALTFTTHRIRFSNHFVLLILFPYILFSGLLYFLPEYFISQDLHVSGALIPQVFYGAFLLCNILYAVAGMRFFVRRYEVSAGVFKTILRSMMVAIGAGIVGVFLLTVINYLYLSEFTLLLQSLVRFCLFLYISFKILRFHRWNVRPFIVELFVALVVLILMVQMSSASSVTDTLVSSVVLILFGISGYFLVQSIERESHARNEIEKLVKDLQEVNSQLHVLDKRKSEFVKISSHHLKSPLTLIKGYSSMILEGSFDKEINNDAKEAIQKIFDASERLVNIIKDFMDISNIESGKMEYEFKDVDLKNLIANVMEEMKVTIEKSGLDTSFNTDEIEGYAVFADAGKLRQVISNLVDNSIKYTPKGQVHLFLKKDKENRKLHLTITDTGVGMSQETIDKLFEKFSRADDANKVNTSGSGLGLYVAKEIMKKHNAKIWVESPGEGKGSTFHLEFEAK